MEAVDFALVDLNNMVCGADCKLCHSSHAVDKCSHLFQLYANYFEQADRILIEKQPLLVGSMLHVEALLYNRWRDKAELVCPKTLHRHFKLVEGDYEARKAMVDKIASPYLNHLPGYDQLRRKHDVGDAYLMCRWHADLRKADAEKACKVEKIAIDLARFKYVKR